VSISIPEVLGDQVDSFPLFAPRDVRQHTTARDISRHELESFLDFCLVFSWSRLTLLV